MRKWRSLQDSRRAQEEQGTGLCSRDAGLRERPEIPKNTESFPVQVGTGANYAVYVIRDTEEDDVEEIEEYEMLDQVKIEYTE